MSDFIIKPTSLEDKEQWLPLWNVNLTFYGTELPDEVTNATWENIHQEDYPVNALGAYIDNQMVAFVTFTYHRSTWSTGYYCYLEDLFVGEQARRKGIAEALIKGVDQVRKDYGATRLYWMTQGGNESARRVYDRLADITDFVQYRVAE